MSNNGITVCKKSLCPIIYVSQIQVIAVQYFDLYVPHKHTATCSYLSTGMNANTVPHLFITI